MWYSSPTGENNTLETALNGSAGRDGAQILFSIELIDHRFIIKPWFNVDFEDFSGIYLINLHNIVTTALKQNIFLPKESDVKRYVKVENPQG